MPTVSGAVARLPTAAGFTTTAVTSVLAGGVPTDHIDTPRFTRMATTRSWAAVTAVAPRWPSRRGPCGSAKAPVAAP